VIKCGQCGELNEDGAKFCGRDRAFLEYVGVPVADTPGGPTDVPVTVTPPSFVPPPGPTTVTPPPYRPPARSGEGTPGPRPPERLIIPPPPPPPAPVPGPGIEEEPGPKPLPEPKRKQLTKQGRRELRPGDRICGRCGEGNRQERNFCRTCGDELTEAEVIPPLPWWRTMFSRQPKPPLNAGDRPSPSGTPRRTPRRLARIVLMVVAAFTILVALAAILPGRNPIKELVADVTSRVRRVVAPEYEQVFPVLATASSSTADHGPELAIDGANNTWWAEGAEGLGINEQITITFGTATDIAKIGISSGTTREPDSFLQEPRPKELFLRFSDGSTRSIELADSADFQSFEVAATSATSVEIQLLSAYPSGSGQNTSLAEVEFWNERS